MAGKETVCFFFCLLTLFSCSEAQSSEASTTECSFDWDITIGNYVIVKWSGTNSNANIFLTANSKQNNDKNCSTGYLELEAEFKARELNLSQLCNNSQYNIEIEFRCETAKFNGNKIIWTPPKPPTNVAVAEITESSFNVSWKRPEGPIEKYRILMNSDKLTPNNTFMVIKNLKPYTNYTIKVSARNSESWSQWSQPVVTQTNIGTPGAPKNLSVKDVTSSSLTLVWEPPDEFNGPFTAYLITEHSSKSIGTSRSYATPNTYYEVYGLSAYTNYTFEVCTQITTGCGPPSKPLSVLTRAGVPFTPGDITIPSTTNTSIYVAWKEPAPFMGPIAKYVVHWTYAEENQEESTSDKSYNITSLHPYTNYSIKVRAATSGGIGQWSKPKTAQTLIGVPSAPKNLTVVSKSNTTISVQWKEPDEPNGPFLSYTIQWEASQKTYMEQTNETSYSMTDLAPYTIYIIKVRAATSAGNGSWSEEVNVKTAVGVPALPRNVTVISKTNTSIYIQWEEPIPSTGPISNYTVKWTNSEMEYIVGTSYNITNLSPYTNYNIEVRASTTAGGGNWTEAKTVQTKVGVPYIPGNLTVKSKTNNSIQMEWEEPQPPTGPIKWYTLRWKKVNEEVEVNVKETTHNITSLLPFTKYRIQVRAVTSAGDGNWSEPVNTETKVGVPHAPKNITLSPTNISVEVRWQEPEPSTGKILLYIVEWNASTTVQKEVSTSLFYNITDLSPYTVYSIRVRAKTDAGIGTWSDAKLVRTGIGVPFSPSITSTEVSNTSAVVRWKDPSLSTGPIEFYTVLWQNFVGNHTAKSSTTSYNISGLTPFTSYELKVRAHTEAGAGNWSAVTDIKTKIGIPFAPKNVSIPSKTNVSITITWQEPQPSTGPILNYTVEWTQGKEVKEETTEETFYMISELKPYTDYSLKVRASTDAGDGEWEDVGIIKTKVGVPFPPINLTVSAITNSSIALLWDEPEISTGPILSYLVEWAKTSKPSESHHQVVKEKFYVITNLQAYTDYSMKVCAATDVGNGNWSTVLIEKTNMSVPSVPVNLTRDKVTDTSISVFWSSPEFPNGPILGYGLRWQAVKRNEIKGHNETKSSHYKIQNLSPYTNYSVQVFAMTPIGRGPWTDEIIIRTNTGVPDAALVHSLKSESPRVVFVKWETRGPYPGPTHYILQAWQKPGECTNRVDDVVEKELRGQVEDLEAWRKNFQDDVFENLTPYTRYYFRVVLSTRAGSQTSEDSMEIRTGPAAPSAPRNLQADCNRSPNEAEVRWKPPERPNGIIDFYLIEYAVENIYDEKTVQVTDMCNEQKVTLRGLRPEKPYEISVRAHVKNVSEDGKMQSLNKHCILPAGIPPVGEATYLQAEGSGPHLVTLEWSYDVFSDAMGALIQYAILVGKIKALVNATSLDDAPPWSNFSSGMSDFYQPSPPGWNPFTEGYDPLHCEQLFKNSSGKYLKVLRCVIGLESQCSENETYCNGPLQPNTEYGMKLRAFTRAGFADTHLLRVRTGTIKEFGIGSLVAAIVSSVVVVLFAAGGSAYIINRKGGLGQIRKNIQSIFAEAEPTPPSNELPAGVAIIDPYQPAGTIILKPYQPIGTLTTETFSEHVRFMMSDTHLRFSQEFEKLKRESPQFPCTIAEMEENRPKNRWMNIFPFDHSRVKLLPLGDEPGSDFINSNYIPGATSLREYIATQGPLPNTVDDFWRMIWEQSVTTIVMLTQCVERGKSKCEQYWPASGEGKFYGDMQVMDLSESMLQSFIIRRFHLQLGSRDRIVKQMHFTRWPDFGCPESPNELVNFVRAVRDHLPRENPGPIVVHCSAGVGRTGTFIAVDKVAQQLQYSDNINIYGTVLELRQHRTNMVQTEDQYIYIHLCVQQLIHEKQEHQEGVYAESIYANCALEDTGV